MSLEKIRDQLFLVSTDIISNMVRSNLIHFHVNSKVNNQQSRLNINSAIDEAWRDPFLVNLRSTQTKPGPDSPGRSFIPQLSTSTIIRMMSIKPCPDPAHTLCFRTFHCPSFCFWASQPLLSISTTSEHLNHFRATLLPSSIASKHPCLRAPASTATSLPGETSMLPSVATTLVTINDSTVIYLSQKATTLVPINGSMLMCMVSNPRSDKNGKRQVMTNMPLRSRATQDSCVPGHYCHHESNGWCIRVP